MTITAFASGITNRHGFTLDIAPRQETLHRCSLCEQWYSRSDMKIVNGVLVCESCAGDAPDESEDE